MDNINCCNSGKKLEKNTKVKIVRIKQKPTDGSISSKCETTQNSYCCGNGSKESCEPITKYDTKQKWIIGEISTSQGCIPRISTKLAFTDTLGTWKVRFGINRMNYKINPGLYAVGTPDDTAPVLVTANYKLTFDTLRKELGGLNAWIVVLDTKGINVWCAAGKGTFGTKELVSRISKVRLSQIVSHKTLVLPQLGAPGISAHEVTKKSGFKVVYGPVRAEDIKKFLEAEMKATEEMREVRFNIIDRVVLTPVEFVSTFKIAMLVFGVMFLINLFAVNPFGVIDFYAFIGALLVGCVITPVLLPWIPVRAFAAKGWIMGLIWAVTVNILNGWSAIPEYGVLKTVAYLLILPSIASYYAMNFTGSSTYTSFSGVIKEMKIAVPAIAVSIGLGVGLLLINSLIHI
ncbi:mercury methylation corrinoid protein HgcA [Clostridium sp. BJN0013]|uniref:mercury methylation corrinoid protein HgcA n=1 Tax=Clostridium sp. BJN0013 TaxID=3236840 RepID=UPI0034C5B96D